MYNYIHHGTQGFYMKYKNKEYISIPNYSRYYINKETANVISLVKGDTNIREVYPTVNRMGYHQYTMLSDNNEKKSLLQHRLLMLTFVKNNDSHSCVNHLDGDKTNNVLGNLEWCSHQHNAQHAYSTNLSTSTHCEVEVHQYTIKGVYVQSFKSIAEASRRTGCSSPNILHYIQGDTPHAKGYLYSYTKKDSLPEYTGKPVLKSIQVKNTLTGETKIFKSIADVAEHTNLHRSKFLRRFKKSLIFMIEEFHIIRTNF